MRITLVISSLSGGGAERVAATLANSWAARGRDVTLLTACGDAAHSCYELDPAVTRRDVYARGGGAARVPDAASLASSLSALANCSRAEFDALASSLDEVLALRGAIAETSPGAVVSFIDLTNVRVLLATRDSGVPVVVTEHSDPRHNRLGEGWEGLRRRLYPEARFVTVPTEEARAYFAPFAGERCRVVPNPVETPPAPPRETVGAARGEPDESSTCAGARTLLAMGRLSYEKGFDLLLYAFGLAAGARPGWRLEVWGEGPLRGELGRLAEGLGLAGRVSFPGFTRRPYEVMRRADLFAVTSRCEGFSNVLAEAMACGLPVVSFDCPSGPRHVIRDGVDGLLVAPQNVSALAATLGRLMSDERERARLASRAPEVLERFGTERVLEEWERLLAFEGTASRR